MHNCVTDADEKRRRIIAANRSQSHSSTAQLPKRYLADYARCRHAVASTTHHRAESTSNRSDGVQYETDSRYRFGCGERKAAKMTRSLGVGFQQCVGFADMVRRFWIFQVVEDNKKKERVHCVVNTSEHTQKGEKE